WNAISTETVAIMITTSRKVGRATWCAEAARPTPMTDAIASAWMAILATLKAPPKSNWRSIVPPRSDQAIRAFLCKVCYYRRLRSRINQPRHLKNRRHRLDPCQRLPIDARSKRLLERDPGAGET